MTNRTDNLNRADTTSNIGTPSDGGSAWNQISGTWGITGNAAYKSATNTVWEIACLESSLSNVDVQATCTSLPVSNNFAGLSGRAADDSNWILLGIENGGNVFMYKKVSGSFTQLGSTFSGTVSVGDVFTLRMTSANDITALQNGISRVTANDAAGAANTQHGFSFNSNAFAFDDFSITSLDGGVIGSNYYRQVAGMGAA